MDDPEGPVIEEDLVEGEDEYIPPDFKIQLKNHLLSLVRQFYCFVSVMMFPVFSIMIDQMQEESPYYPETDEDFTKLEEKQNQLKVQADITISICTGLIIAGVLLHSIGRKYMVLAVNLCYLICLLYLYLIGTQDEISYNLKIPFYGLHYASLLVYVIYVAEITRPIYRAFFIGLYQFYDIIFDKILGSMLEENEGNRMLLYGTVMATFTSLFTLFIPETPFWLLLIGNPEKAEETFLKLSTNSNSDITEFNQTVARAENIIEEKGIMRHLYTQTFALGLTFSFFIVICSFSPCNLLVTVTHDFYYPAERHENHSHLVNIRLILLENELRREKNFFKGQLIFLIVNFFIPRKILFLISYLFGILTTVPVGLKLGSVETLIEIASYCTLTPFIGTESLVQILPAEIYPAALREVGMVATGIFLVANDYILLYSYSEPSELFPVDWVYTSVTWTIFYASIVGILFILIFMPETRNRSLYELQELKLTPFGDQGTGAVDEYFETENE